MEMQNKRKAEIVLDHLMGKGRDEIIKEHSLSVDDFNRWVSEYKQGGAMALWEPSSDRMKKAGAICRFWLGDWPNSVCYRAVMTLNTLTAITLIFLFIDSANAFPIQKTISLRVAFTCAIELGTLSAVLYASKCAIEHYAQYSTWNSRWFFWYLTHIISGAVSSTLGIMSMLIVRANPDDIFGVNIYIAAEMMVLASIAGYQGTKYIDRLIKENKDKQKDCKKPS